MNPHDPDGEFLCAYGTCDQEGTFRVTPKGYPYAGLCAEHARLLCTGEVSYVIGGDQLRYLQHQRPL